MAPSSRMNLASLLQPDSEEPARRPSSASQPPATPYVPPTEPNYPPPSFPASSQNFSNSQYPYPSQPSQYHQHSYSSHHSHQYHSHHHHHAPMHTHLPPHPPHHHHTHHHPHHPPHAHVHVIHSHPTASAPSAPAPSGSPSYPSSSHAFSGSARGPQPIIPITPAPRSPVAALGASRSPTAPYSIYGAGAALGRRSPMPADYPPHPSSSSGSRRNTLSGPQAIEPVPLRDYAPYPSGSAKHDEPYPPPPAFSAPVYGSRPESPQTGKSRRSGPTTNRPARSASTKRSMGGAGDKHTSDRSRERDEHEELMRERERERLALDREQERARDREREHDEHARAARERERDRDRDRDRDRERQHDLDMRRPKRIDDFARRPAEWDRRREWRQDDLAQGKHLPPIAHAYPDKHAHPHSIPPIQPRPQHTHHYHPPASPPPATPPQLLSPVWLGTHVYPNLPFPLCLPPSLSRNNLSADGYRPYQYTILVPYGFLPLQPASRTPRPAIALWGNPSTGYTDDSNIVLAAVHSNRTSWTDIRRARRQKQDAKIIVGVWAGGANGGRNATRPKGGAWEGGAGSGQLFSSSWGNSHDGGGMEIVSVTWLEKGAAHAPHRPNRRDRMEQYAQRRADLDLVPPVKRDRIDTWYLDSDDEDVVIPAKRTWDVGETIVFGKGGTTSGFVYDPHALRSVVFEESNERSTKRVKTEAVRRDIVLENDDEQYILTVNPDKEGEPRTYTLLTLSPNTKKTEVLRKSLTEQDVAFFDKGLCVWLKGDEVHEGDEDKMDTDTDRKGWFCHVNRWKFAEDNVTTRDE